MSVTWKMTTIIVLESVIPEIFSSREQNVLVNISSLSYKDSWARIPDWPPTCRSPTATAPLSLYQSPPLLPSTASVENDLCPAHFRTIRFVQLLGLRLGLVGLETDSSEGVGLGNDPRVLETGELGKRGSDGQWIWYRGGRRILCWRMLLRMLLLEI